ncbi:hypothetical protein C8J57DRAFT_1301626, partial [Mycena rebaudengoi]
MARTGDWWLCGLWSWSSGGGRRAAGPRGGLVDDEKDVLMWLCTAITALTNENPFRATFILVLRTAVALASL